MKTLDIRQKLIDKNISIFSPWEFQKIMELNRRNTSYYLENGVNNGLFIRLKRGLYALKTDFPTQPEIANWLYRPSYISFEYALAHYNVLPEMVYTITSATSKPTREFVVADTNYRYTTIKTSAYTGYEIRELNGKRCQMAEPEKAFADYLYVISLGRRAVSERLMVKALDFVKVQKYARLFQSQSLEELVQTYTS